MNLNALGAELKLMTALYNNGQITFNDLVAKSGLSEKTVRKYMPQFVRAGLCKKEGDHYCIKLACEPALGKLKKQFREEVSEIDWRLR